MSALFSLALPHVAQLHAYTPGLQPTEPGWVKLNTNECPYPPSPRVAEALQREIGGDGASLRLYPNPKSTPLRAAIHAFDAELPLFDVRTMAERIDGSLVSRRVPLQLIGLFSALALLLAAVGIYGVLAFAVAQRTGEFGVRMAIGANAAKIERQVLGDGARLVGTGLAIGIAGALALGFALRSQLFGIAAIDPPSLAAVVALLAAVALAACWLPARRAARVSPMTALRHE